MTGIPGLTGDLILDHAFGLLLVLGRVGATFALMPGLGEATVPAQIKGGMILMLSLLLLPGLGPLLPPRPDTETAFALMLMAEMANGLWFGWLARAIATSLPMAGQLISELIGVSNVLMPSPDLGSQTSAIARLHEIAVPALLLTSGLYMLPLAALAGFYRLIPPGTLSWATDSAELTVATVSESFMLALRLAAPFVLASVAWNLAVGLVARLVPRLQVFFVVSPGQIALGLLLLASLSIPLIGAWMEAMRASLASLPGGG